MSDLILVRHGQAGATPENYDELSPLGFEQGRRLGHWLLAHERDFAALVVGRMRRQRETLAAIVAVYSAAGRSLPAAEVLPGLDEYRFADMVRAFAERHPQHAELTRVRELPTDRGRWVGLLRTTLAAWTAGALDAAPESYAEFQARTSAALAEIERRLQQGPVLAVSSAGVISQIGQRVLGYNDATAIDVNMSLLNTSLSEYRLTRAGLKLGSLNALPHLAAPADRELITAV